MTVAFDILVGGVMISAPGSTVRCRDSAHGASANMAAACGVTLGANMISYLGLYARRRSSVRMNQRDWLPASALPGHQHTRFALEGVKSKSPPPGGHGFIADRPGSGGGNACGRLYAGDDAAALATAMKPGQYGGWLAPTMPLQIASGDDQ